MAEEEKKVVSDETGYINTEELRDVLKGKEKEEEKKECWLKRLFKKKNKKYYDILNCNNRILLQFFLLCNIIFL